MATDPSFQANLVTVLQREIGGYREFIACERLSSGASQETYQIRITDAHGERKLALRRAAGGVKTERAPSQPGLPTEARLFQCAREAGVPEPEIYYVLSDADGMGDGFLMQWLDGETLGARIVRSDALAEARAGLAYQCGEVLARIHAIDLDSTGLRDLLDPLTPHDFVHEMWNRYQEYGTPQPMIDFTARWLLDNLPVDYELGLVHNDFRNGNVMVTPEGLNAVLDWETAHIGDPMRDLGWICTNSWRFGRTEKPVGGFGTYQDLFAGYQAESGRKVDPDHVKFWEVFGSFWWAVGCLTMAEHYRSGPDKTVERPGIGRRSSECQVDCVNLLIPGPVHVAEAAPFDSTLDMPRADELLISVRDFLRADVMPATEGRTSFMARVAANSLDIVVRELAIGAHHRAGELQRLQRLFGTTGDNLETLRWKLVHALRDASLALDTAGLSDHLRQTVVTQVAIDQPRYTGYRTALAHSKKSAGET
ncbi:MAG: phosphotransferase [Gammaproteobacteria bacterium]|nr:phosphotransferase [Gammaproteobacteria bacterium]